MDNVTGGRTAVPGFPFPVDIAVLEDFLEGWFDLLTFYSPSQSPRRSDGSRYSERPVAQPEFQLCQRPSIPIPAPASSYPPQCLRGTVNPDRYPEQVDDQRPRNRNPHHVRDKCGAEKRENSHVCPFPGDHRL